MDKGSPFFPFGKLWVSLWGETGGFGWLPPRLLRMFQLHLSRKCLEGFKLVHTLIIERIF